MGEDLGSALAVSCWVAAAAVCTLGRAAWWAVPRVVSSVAVSASFLFPTVTSEVSKSLASITPLSFHAVEFNTVDDLLSKEKPILNCILGCFFSVEPDPQGRVLAEGVIFLLHPGYILNLRVCL